MTQQRDIALSPEKDFSAPDRFSELPLERFPIMAQLVRHYRDNGVTETSHIAVLAITR